MVIKTLKDLFQQTLATQNSTDNQANKLELAATVLMLEISLADANLDQTEKNTIKDILVKHFGQSAQMVEQLIELAENELDQAVSLHEFTSLLNQELDHVEKITLVELLWRVAFADKVLDKYEEYYLRKIADLLYVSHSDYIKAKHRVAETIKK